MESYIDIRNVLSCGYVKFLDVMPRITNTELKCDEAIVSAARTSYDKKSSSYEDDVRIIQYMMRHNHTSPFEMAELKFEVYLPISSARQWMRHRTGNYNELSLRYTVAKPDFNVHNIWRHPSDTNKQSSSGEFEDEELTKMIEENNNKSYEIYNKLIEKGVCKEQARDCLPVSTYTKFVYKTDLHNLFNFLRLRMSPHAQYEIRVYANAIFDMIKPFFPISIPAFEKYKLHCVTFSVEEQKILAKMLSNSIEVVESPLSKGEQREFYEKIDSIVKL